MPRKQHARCPSHPRWFSAGSVALGVIVLSALALPSLGDASAAKHSAHTLSVRKQMPKCTPTESTPAKDLPAGSAASSQVAPESTGESQIQDSQGAEPLKLESGRKDNVQAAEPECAPGQNSTDDAPCQAAKTSRDSALQCVRDPAQKPDLAIDPAPGK